MPLDEAIEATCTGIKAYAESLGAMDKFHRTMTEARARIIDGRMPGGGGRNDWRSFVAANRDLVEDCLGVLERYYTRERLFSDAANPEYLAADRTAHLRR